MSVGVGDKRFGGGAAASGRGIATRVGAGVRGAVGVGVGARVGRGGGAGVGSGAGRIGARVGGIGGLKVPVCPAGAGLGVTAGAGLGEGGGVVRGAGAGDERVGGAGVKDRAGARGGAGANGSTTNSPCGMSGSASAAGSRMSSLPCSEGEGTRADGVVSWAEGSPVCSQRGGLAAPVAASTRFSEALKTSAQRPQRTQPADTRNWSGTTRKTVLHAGQREARLVEGGVIVAHSPGQPRPGHPSAPIPRRCRGR